MLEARDRVEFCRGPSCFTFRDREPRRLALELGSEDGVVGVENRIVLNLERGQGCERREPPGLAFGAREGSGGG